MTRYADIAGWPGYRVGNDGTVWTSKLRANGGWRLLRLHCNRDGYMRVMLSHRNVQQSFHVHRLVAEAFHGACPPGQLCRHLDGNPSNNHASNLAWGTFKDNEADKARHGRRPIGANVSGAKLTDAAVILMRNDFAAGMSLRCLAKQHDLNVTTVIEAVHGRTFSHVPVPSYIDRRIPRRQQYGEANRHAKLIAGDIQRIRDLSRSGCTQQKIADYFDVALMTINHIVKGRTWKTV